MRWMTANKTQICTACVIEIPVGQHYFGNSYSSFCIKCGKLKQSGDLVYRPERKGYMNLKDVSKCDYCELPATGHLHGKAICDEHIGKAVDI